MQQEGIMPLFKKKEMPRNDIEDDKKQADALASKEEPKIMVVTEQQVIFEKLAVIEQLLTELLTEAKK